MADTTNLKIILSDLYSITSGTWAELSGHQIKSFTNSDSISGDIDTNGSLKLDVNVSNFVANDVTNALTIKSDGLYVGLPLAQNDSFGLVKAGTGVSISDGVLSVSSVLASEYSISKVATETGYAATYQLTKDGVAIGDKINIIKDQFLKDAEIITATADDKAIDDSVVVDGTYIKFTFELSTDDDVEGEEDSTKVIYLDASSLVNVDEITQVKKVEDFEDSTISALCLTVDTLLFTADGETRIFNAEINDLIDCSEETVDVFNDDTNENDECIPTVLAVKTYVQNLDEELSGILNDIQNLKSLMGIVDSSSE